MPTGDHTVLITAVCPRCQTRYQLEDALCGQRIRCPNSICREIFEVQAVEQFPAPVPVEPVVAEPTSPALPSNRPSGGPLVPPETVQAQGSVGHMVPILSAEVAGEAPPAPANPARGTSDLVKGIPLLPAEAAGPIPLPPAAPRPSRRPGAGKKESPISAPNPPSVPGVKAQEEFVLDLPVVGPEEASPVELPPGTWEAPPIRRGVEESQPAAQHELLPAPSRGPGKEDEDARAGAHSQRARLLILGIALTVVLVLIGAGSFAFYWYRGQEGRLARRAQDEYEQGHYANAANIYQGLAEDFPKSEHRDEYRFLAMLGKLRAEVYLERNEPSVRIDKVAQFLVDHPDDTRLKERSRDLGETLVKAIDDLTESIKDKPERENLKAVEHAEKLLADLNQRFPGAVPESDRQRLGSGFDGLRQGVAHAEQRQQLLGTLKRLAERPSWMAIQETRDRIQKEAATQPGLDKDAQVQDALTGLYKAHLDSVRYVPASADAALVFSAPSLGAALPSQLPLAGLDWIIPGSPPEDGEPATLLAPAPLLEGLVPRDSPDERIIPALARGVLYFLPQTGSTPRWAVRLGIDTTVLPVRLPATATAPERFLAVSTDTRQVLLLDPRARKILWQRTLPSPVLGAPLILETRAFVPTLGGDVVEIDLADGLVVGRYPLGQRLTIGGARQENTGLLYFPADEGCLYVLDVVKHQCRTILYTEHPGDSLHGPPLVLNWGNQPGEPTKEDSPGWLILSQSSGLAGTRLRTFALPLPETPGPAVSRNAELTIPGWSWFPPYCDGEKLLVVTDAGVVGLFGLPWPRLVSDVPYPWLAQPHQVPRDAAGQVVRAQLAYAQERTFWVLAQGVLSRLELAFHRQNGWQIVPLWSKPAMGVPLHAAQVDDEGRQLFLVTQSLTGQTCQATAVETDNGRTLWRRQLGLVARGEPLLLRRGQETGALVLDQGGGLFLFDPRRPEFGGQMIAYPFPDTVVDQPYLLPGEGGAAWEIACTRDERGTYRLWVRSYGADLKRTDAILDKWPPYEIAAPLAGAPAVGTTHLLIPLADGSLVGLALAGASKPETFPDWRARQGDSHAVATVLWLNGEEYLTADGDRGLTRWRWATTQKRWQGVPAGKDYRNPTLELPTRLVGLPLLIPGQQEGEQQALCLADASGLVTLRRGEEFEKVIRRWQLKGTVTAGPFLRDGKVGLVLDRRRLVWLDPGQEAPLWQRDLGQLIVGAPQTMGAGVLVACVSGRYQLLDAATGKERGPGYALKSNVAPATAPVPFGTDRVLAPLTDGMIMLLPRDLFEERAP